MQRKINPKIMEQLKKQVKALCRQNGTTQKELAEKIGVSPIALSKIINGGNPTLHTLERIAEALSVSAAELLTDRSDFVAFVRYKGEVRVFDSPLSLRVYSTRLK